LRSGLGLGVILGLIGYFKIILWPNAALKYGEHFMLLGWAVAVSVVCVVVWGTLAGSTLPLILKRLGFDPASASGPFVATLVDVTGIMIYFSIASWALMGVL